MLIKLAIVFLFVGTNIILAYHDAERIKVHLRIYHGLNALLYALLLLPVYIHLKDWFFIIGLLCLRKVVFDTSLNVMRGLRFDYISSSTGSLIDKLSYRFQAKYGYVPYYGTFIIITILSIIL